LTQILHFDQLGGASLGLYRTVILVNAELIRIGLADDFSVPWDHRAVVAVEDEVIQGFITYNRLDWCKHVNIAIGYVFAEHRKKGLYRWLWDELVTVSKAAGYQKIYGVVKKDNHAMLAVAAALGRVEESINMEFTL
jgi:GNAT superfamily N-acetyltransferase